MNCCRASHWAVGFGLALIGAGAAPAQEKKTDTRPAPVQPAPEMLRLSQGLLGTWDVSETYLPGPGLPQGGRGRGGAVIATGPGNLSLILDYRAQGPAGPLAGHSVITWSPEEKVYHKYWVESAVAGGLLLTGRWEGASLVFTGRQLQMGRPFTLRFTLSGLSEKGFHILYEMGPEGGRLAPLVEYRFTRAPGGAKRKQEPAPGARRN
jgi:hypothetical protein